MDTTTSRGPTDGFAPRQQNFELRRSVGADKVFPPALPQNLPNFTIGSVVIPGRMSGGISGDGCEMFPVTDAQWGLLIADASGTGIQAARRVVKAESIVRSVLHETADPALTLARMNEALVMHMAPRNFVTLCCAILDVDLRQITIASAGHPPTLWFHADTQAVCELCPCPGLMAGVLPNQEYKTEKAVIAPGDVLVFYTDGLTESRRDTEQFGLSRLRDALAACARFSAGEIAVALYNAARDFTGTCPEDDVVLLILKAT